MLYQELRARVLWAHVARLVRGASSGYCTSGIRLALAQYY